MIVAGRLVLRSAPIFLACASTWWPEETVDRGSSGVPLQHTSYELWRKIIGSHRIYRDVGRRG